MHDDPPRDRRYDEHEVSLILQRAAELQLRAPERVGGAVRDGMSLAELEAIAVEAGLDAAHVRRAATQLATQVATQLATRPVSSGTGGLLGAPLRVTAEREVPGEVPAAAFESIGGEIRRRLGHDGRSRVRGRSLTWTSTSLTGGAAVSVSPSFGSTVVHAERHLGDYALGVSLAMGVGGVVACIVTGAGIALADAMTGTVAASMAGITIAGAYLSARVLVRRKARATQRHLQEVVDVVAGSVSRAMDVGPER